MRSYLTLHYLIRCCWVSKFAALISRGQLNAILCWISPCNLVCCSPAGAHICAMTVDWPLGDLLLRHTTVHLHAKQPTQCYKMSRSALYCHAVISNDSAKCVAILNAYLYFYGIAAVKSRDISLLPKSRYLLKWFFLCMCGSFLYFYFSFPCTCVCAKILCSFNLTKRKVRKVKHRDKQLNIPPFSSQIPPWTN